MMFPDMKVRWEDKSELVAEARYVQYLDAAQEKSIGSVRPDVTLMRAGEACPLLIEIYVAHAVDDRKIQQLKTIGFPCIEVNVRSALSPDGFDREELERILVHSKDPSYKRWLCFPNEDRHLAKLKEEVIAERKARELEARRHAELVEAAREQARREAEARYQEMRQQGAIDLVEIRERAELLPSYAESKHPDGVPLYISPPLVHEDIFAYPREQWQSFVYHQYVRRARVSGRYSLTQPARATVDASYVVHRLVYMHAGLLQPGIRLNQKRLSELDAVVCLYLEYLESIGILKATECESDSALGSVFEIVRMI